MHEDMHKIHEFRQRVGFLGLVGVSFTCCTYLMSLLRPVLEPFMWALFLVIAIQPLVTLFEIVLLRLSRLLCGCRREGAAPRTGIRAADAIGAAKNAAGVLAAARRRGPAGYGNGMGRARRLRDDEEGEEGATPPQGGTPRVPTPRLPGEGVRGGASSVGAQARDFEVFDVLEDWPAAPQDARQGDQQKLSLHEGEESLCTSCCQGAARVVSVACALTAVMGVGAAVLMVIFEGAMRLKDNYEVYERGAENFAEASKELMQHVYRGMPRSVVDEISDNVLNSAKALISELLGELIAHAGRIMVELLMLGLYVMFWLCTPMPLNSDTESIFRRYMFLKGSACLCYGVCVGVMLRVLEVELAGVFGLMSFFFSFVPEVGALIAMILPVPVILFDSRLEAPAITLVIASTGQLCLKFVFANIIEVKLVENDATMKMHPVMTLLSVTFFGFIWGPTGMLLSVPMMTYLKVVLLSDTVPAAYRDPVLVLLEGDRRAPERHRLLRKASGKKQDAD